jgi:hypothetical protein
MRPPSAFAITKAGAVPNWGIRLLRNFEKALDIWSKFSQAIVSSDLFINAE